MGLHEMLNIKDYVYCCIQNVTHLLLLNCKRRTSLKRPVLAAATFSKLSSTCIADSKFRGTGCPPDSRR